MGLCCSLDARTLYLSSLYLIWRLEATQELYQQGFDRTYISQVANTASDIDTHDKDAIVVLKPKLVAEHPQ